MAARTQPPPKDVTGFVVAGSGVAALLTLAAGLPGALVLWVGLVAAAFMAPAPVLTGKEGKPPRPVPAGPGEAKAMRTYRIWADLRWRLMVPTVDWLPGWPVFASWAGAVGVAAAVSTLQVRTGVPGWLAAVNAVAAFVVIAQVSASRRRFATDDDRSPGVRFSTLADWVRSGVLARIMASAAVCAGLVLAASIFLLVTDSPLIGGLWGAAGELVVAAISGPLLALAIVAGPWTAHAMTPWRELVAARAQWKPRWQQVGIKDDAPFLVKREQVGPATVETFDAPPSSGAASFFTAAIAAKITTSLGTNMRVSVLETPNLDGSGQPVPGSVHPVRFDVVVFPSDQWPNLADPSLTEDLARLMMRAAVADTCDRTGYARYLLTDMVRVSDHPQEQPAPTRSIWSRLAAPLKRKAASTSIEQDDEGELLDDEDVVVLTKSAPGDDEQQEPAGSPAAVWATGWVNTAGLGPSILRHTLREQIAASAGVPVLVDHRSRGGAGAVFFGPASDPAVVFDPANGITIEQMIDLEREDQWRPRFAAVLKQDANAPKPELALYREIPTKMGTIFYQPFVTLNGEDPAQYFGLETKLKATLNGAPFLSITGFTTAAERPGERHAQAFAIAWSASPMPAGPHSLAPQPRTTRPYEDVGLHILAGRMNEAFKAARLAQPEVASAQCLTKATSRGHIWAISMRLYGGVTLSDVRGQVARIRTTLGSPWLRVAAAEDGCVIFAGERPEKVELTNERRDRQRLVALDWEQAWLDSKVSGVGGLLPNLTATDVLPRNDKVQVLDFALPSGIAISDVKAATEKLKTSTGNAFIEVRPGTAGPSTVRLLVCEVNPLPDSAPYDFVAIDGSKGIPFATGIDGDEITYNPRVDPHLLVAGASGGGKSVTLQAIIYGALIRGWDVYVADPTKGAADFKFAMLYSKAMTVDPFEAAAMMKAVYAEVVRRKNLNSQYGVGNYRDLPEDVRPPHMLVVIDEFTSLMGQDPVPKPSDDPEMDAERELIVAGNQAKTEIGVYTGKCAREARSAGLTLVLATQKLAAALLDTIPGAGDLKVNLSRMLLGKATNGDRMSALRAPFEAPELGDSVPPGRGLWETTEGAAKVMQAWYDPREQAVLAEELASRIDPLDEDERLDFSSFVTRPSDEQEAPGPRRRARKAAPVEQVVELAPIVLTLEDLVEDDSPADAPGEPREHASTDDDGFRDLDMRELLWGEQSVPEPDLSAAQELTVVAVRAPHGPITPEVPAAVEDVLVNESAVVFLDIDGVLAPMGPSRAWPDMETIKVKAGHVLASRTALAQAGRLPAQVVWASDWEASAQPSFGPLIGRPDAEYLSPNAEHENFGWWKIGAAHAWLASHPEVTRAVWIDDRLQQTDELGVEHAETIREVLASVDVQVLSITPEPMAGLTAADLSSARDFLAGPAGTVEAVPADPALQVEPVPVEQVRSEPEPDAPVRSEPELEPAAPAGPQAPRPARVPKPKTYTDEW